MNRSRCALHAEARGEWQVIPWTVLLLVACALSAASCSGTVANGQNGAAGQGLAPANLSAFFDCLRESGRTIVAAHRGGPSSGFPENAVSTFENTLRQVPAILEIDIVRTRDGVLVLMHDETVDRTTTGTGRISDLTLSQLQTLRLEDRDGLALDVGVPTLREVLDWSAGKAMDRYGRLRPPAGPLVSGPARRGPRSRRHSRRESPTPIEAPVRHRHVTRARPA